MGQHFAVRLAQEGAHVVIGDVNGAGLKETVSLVAGVRGRISARRVDVSDEKDVVAFVDWADSETGGVNGLVNNAGILRDGLLVKRDKETGEVKRLTKEQWDAVIGVNLTGAAMLARECVAKVAARSRAGAAAGTCSGVVVNMSSVARHGNRGQSNYSAAKAGLAALTKTWSLEWAQFGVRCGAVAPGMVETPMTRGMNQKARDALVAVVPVGRIGTPEDLWLAVRFVLECDYFNGRTIDVDGGLVL